MRYPLVCVIMISFMRSPCITSVILYIWVQGSCLWGGTGQAANHLSCIAVNLTESCRYALSAKNNDIPKVLHLHFYENRKTEVHYQNHSYPLYTATLPPVILLIKEQQCRSNEILWVCSQSYPQSVSLEDTFSVKQTFCVFPLAQRKIMQDCTWWPLLSRVALPLQTWGFCPYFQLSSVFFHGLPFSWTRRLLLVKVMLLSPQQATGLPGFLALSDTWVSQVVGLIEPLAVSSWLHAGSPAARSLPLSFFTVFALYDCCLCCKLWWKQLIDFGCCQWMVYRKGMEK